MRKTQITKHLAENNIPESWIVELRANRVELLAPESMAYYERDVAQAMSQVLFADVLDGYYTYSGYDSITFEFSHEAKLTASAVRSNLIDQLGGEGAESLAQTDDEPRGFYFWNGSEELYTTDAAEFLSWVIG